MFETEPLSRAAESRDHLVGNQQHVILVAYLANSGKVIVLRHDQTPCALHGFGDEGRNGIRTFAEDRFLELIRRRAALAEGRVVRDISIGIRRRNVNKPGKLTTEHRPIRRDAGCAHGAHRHTMIGVLAADDLDLFGLALADPEKARGFNGAVVRIPAARGEEEMIH